MGSDWLSRLRERASRKNKKSKSVNHRRRQDRRPSHAETLEQRTLLTVNTLFAQGDLTIVSDNQDDIVIGSDSMTGLVTLDVNGVADPAFPIILANQVESLLIVGSDSENTIDLTGITSTAFSFMDTNGGITIEVDAGNGDDTILGSPDIAATLRGGDGNDVITSTDPADTIFAGDGADTVTGGDGNDSIIAGDGDDVVTGDAGDDVISGDNGADSISGGDGADAVTAGDGPDTVTGDAGNDTLDGESGTDVINGNDDDDSLIGGPGNDTIMGDAGDDFIDGQANEDSLLGGDGDDQIFGSRGRDSIFGGDGNDFLQGDLGNDSIEGETGNDTVFGGGGGDFADGGADNDSLFGNSGNDTLIAGGGDDSLSGGAGNDLLDGGAISFAITDFTVDPEGNMGTFDATFIVSLSSPLSITATVDVETVDDTATAGQDYQAVPLTTLSFAPGVVTQSVTVTVLADTIAESDETFFVNLSNPVGAVISDPQGLGTIVDDDVPAPPPTPNMSQVVFIDFDSQTAGADHVYTTAERDAIEMLLDEDFLPFGVDWVQTAPATGQIQIFPRLKYAAPITSCTSGCTSTAQMPVPDRRNASE